MILIKVLFFLSVIFLTASAPAESLMCQEIFIQGSSFYSDPSAQDIERELHRLYSTLPSHEVGFDRERIIGAIHRNYKKLASYFHKYNPGKPFPLVMLPDYIGETLWRTTFTPDGDFQHRVHYLSDEELSFFEVSVKNGKLYQPHNNQVINESIVGIFVVSLEEKMYVKWLESPYVNDLSVFFHHSSFSNGTPILYAGTIKVSADGTVQYLDNQSGHYRTPENRKPWIIDYLIKKGFIFSDDTTIYNAINQTLEKWSTLSEALNSTASTHKQHPIPSNAQ